MLVVKDLMVLIHLAKMTLLETSCTAFGNVAIPEQVMEEVTKEGYPDAQLIAALIRKEKILVRAVRKNQFLQKAYACNIQRAEAAAVALSWELEADFLATDDDNVRKKSDLLKLNVIGTPAILLKLYKEKRITRIKVEDAIKKLKEIGWFANTIWDKIKLEVEKNA